MRKMTVVVILSTFLAAPTLASDGFKEGGKEIGQGFRKIGKETGQGFKEGGREIDNVKYFSLF